MKRRRVIPVLYIDTKKITDIEVIISKIRILLIEDNRILRDGITSMINDHGDMTVVGVSDGKDDTLKKAHTVKPDVVLMDIGLASRNSLEIVQHMKKDFSKIKIIGMGLSFAQFDIMEFVQAGADGFILKDASVTDVIKTIRDVSKGQRVLPPLMTGSLFSQVAELAVSKGKNHLKSAIRMTQREKEVISLIVDGMSNKQISSNLNIATFTVKSHVHNILEKLSLNSRLQIAKHARDVETD